MRKSIMYVGMDRHKESIEIATAEEGRHGEVRRYGRIDGDRPKRWNRMDIDLGAFY